MQTTGGFGFLIYFTVAVLLSGYFAFAAVRGDLGVLERLQMQAEIRALAAERDSLAVEVEALSNLTARMSDRFLDLDLLDEQARERLGWMRPDELTIR